MKNTMQPVHPGEILREEFLGPLELSAYRLAKDLKVPTNRITGIVNEERAITAETAVLLGHYFDISAAFWMNLQTRYDLRIAQRAKAGALKKLPKHAQAAA